VARSAVRARPPTLAHGGGSCYTFAIVRAAFVTADLLATEEEGRAALHRLAGAGLRTVVLASASEASDWMTSAAAGVVHAVPASSGGWGERADAMARAAAEADVHLGEAFLLCGTADDVLQASELGCRPVLVLDQRSLTDVLGAHEPETKGFSVAADLGTAVGYIADECAQDQELGPFPFGAHRAVDERSAAFVPTAGDVAKMFVIVTAAGVAVALGIAYLLQEIYQRVAFPAVAYWLTLQFIPQTFRGLLFLLIGATAGLFAQRAWQRVTGRRTRA
jgi:hypothetical protein